MRLPLLFRRENSSAAVRERKDAVEKALTQSLRKLSDVMKKLADVIETRRLERGGYPEQEAFLERLPKKDEPR
jgi:hypothetical protein